MTKTHSDCYTLLTNPVRRIQSGPEPEVLGLAAALALGHRDVVLGEGAGGPGQRELGYTEYIYRT